MIKRAECCGNCANSRDREEEIYCTVDTSRDINKCTVCEYDFEDYLEEEE